jgi:glycosyltransferase involved in cell wall biosynthesis
MNGANAERKCLPEIIRAAGLIHEDHPEIKFLIAGEKSTYYPVLKEMVRNMGAEGYIEFPGVVTKEKKIEYMQNCGVYLQPSRFEGFGLAILEAMSCGAPVVTSAAGALPELTGDTAVIVDGRSPENIASAVDKLLRSAELRKNIGMKARHRAESVFSFEVRKQKLGEVIEGLLG